MTIRPTMAQPTPIPACEPVLRPPEDVDCIELVEGGGAEAAMAGGDTCSATLS